MTTATCTCGAIHFDGARHVNDCPAGNPMQCDCGAVNFEGAQHKVTCPMISATHSAYVPPQPPQIASQGPSAAQGGGYRRGRPRVPQPEIPLRSTASGRGVSRLRGGIRDRGRISHRNPGRLPGGAPRNLRGLRIR